MERWLQTGICRYWIQDSLELSQAFSQECRHILILESSFLSLYIPERERMKESENERERE